MLELDLSPQNLERGQQPHNWKLVLSASFASDGVLGLTGPAEVSSCSLLLDREIRKGGVEEAYLRGP